MTYAPQSVTARNTALLELDGEKALGPMGLVRGGLAYRKLHTLTGNKNYDLFEFVPCYDVYCNINIYQPFSLFFHVTHM
jgi:hypothetical protein